VQSARDALTQAQAGATPEAIAAAHAQANAAQAMLAQAEIIAPFSGTVASIQVKSGDVVTANTPAVALIPNGSFEVDVYLSEVDAAKIVVGDTADVTLDAFGPGVIFPATVGIKDTAPTIVNGVPSYKATLVFRRGRSARLDRYARERHHSCGRKAGRRDGAEQCGYQGKQRNLRTRAFKWRIGKDAGNGRSRGHQHGRNYFGRVGRRHDRSRGRKPIITHIWLNRILQ
jgi:hypothetical protein